MRAFETSQKLTVVSSWHYCFVFRRGHVRITASRLADLIADFVIFFSPSRQWSPPPAHSPAIRFILWHLHGINSKSMNILQYIKIYYNTWLHKIHVFWECPLPCFHAYGLKPSPLPETNFGNVKNVSVLCLSPWSYAAEPLSNNGASNAKLEITNCRHADMKSFTWFSVSLNQPLNSTDHQHIGIMKDTLRTHEYVDFFFFK